MKYRPWLQEQALRQMSGLPLAELQRLLAVERRATAEVLDDAEVEVTLAGHWVWVETGRPGAVSHEEAMAELLDER